MRAANTILIALIFILSTIIATTGMPDSFYKAMSNMRTENTICVKNYDAGASFTESYRDFEHLERETEIESRSYNTSSNQSDLTPGNASLEVRMRSNVQGKAHIAWQSRDILPDRMGRHATYSRASEDLTGVFNIEKFIQLWSNSTLGAMSTDWLPCS
ncbi:MAG: hypothetical protein KBA97_06185 [Methanothrix sp.]|jgi:hypothetical protein|nr:hypothetical protein [Methanothrix sp.]HOU69821.1 hypothetical protein [Methanothrix sp.]HQJ78917.1 hypothetical protein [Methanothrix sp.]HUM80392.1 hypothetical protein [Methanothrix sp.]